MRYVSVCKCGHLFNYFKERCPKCDNFVFNFEVKIEITERYEGQLK